MDFLISASTSTSAAIQDVVRDEYFRLTRIIARVISSPEVIMKKNDNTIILIISPAPKIDWRAYNRGLRETRDKLLALHRRRGMPDVQKMGKKQFEQELKLFEELGWSRYLPKSLKERARQFDCEARIRTLRDARHKLLVLHRRHGMPDAGMMNCQSFARENALFERLAGTTFLPRHLFKRATEIHRELQSRAAGTTNW